MMAELKDSQWVHWLDLLLVDLMGAGKVDWTAFVLVGEWGAMKVVTLGG